MSAVAIEQWLEQAVRAQIAGDSEGAARGYRRVLEINPGHCDAMLELGNVLQAQGRADEAVRHLEASAARCPEMPELYTNLANALCAQGRREQALEVYRKALDLRSDYPEALNNMGVALKQLGRWDEAATCLCKAVALRPQYVAALRNLGNVLKHLGDAPGAIDCYRRALDLSPNDPLLYCAVGDACQTAGMMTEAGEFYEQALRISPELPQARWNRALLWLKQGDFERGWREYEWGFAAGKRPRRAFPWMQWDGGDLTGKAIYVWGEQGLGDTLQFVRFLPRVKARGAHVVLEVQPGLGSLLAGVAGADRVVERTRNGSASEECDCHASLMSLPSLLNITRDDLPGPVPYITADASSRARWADRVSGDGLKVGIVWAGNPTHQNDRNRSCRAGVFGPLLSCRGVRWFSLQKGGAADQLSELDSARVVALGVELEDFAETAAVIAGLDLVITVDTAIGHLAGAMGRPVWCLLPFDADWRWLHDLSATPWYPSMRLFRQPRPNDWEAVFGEVRKALVDIAAPDEKRPVSSECDGSTASAPPDDINDRRLFNRSHVEYHEARLQGARRMLAPVLGAVAPSSVLDVGCGIGAWLEAAAEHGITDVIGVDGEWIDCRALRVPVEKFHAMDLARPLDLGRRFDLVISLEVAEHLPAERAESFVDDLVRHGDLVLFSAAIPGQGGNGHVNEQFQDRWAREFARHDYAPTDLVRRRIWGDPHIFWWLQQNAVLYVKRSRLNAFPELARLGPVAPETLPVVHPALYAQWLRRCGAARS